MKVLVAMSGGVDSSVAAALLVEQGHHVTGVTLKLWGGASDSGCCSVGDVEDARRVAEQLGIHHHVFNFSDVFESTVVSPYVTAHASGRTPNPCIECNRHLKFGVLLERCVRLGYDALATGHHADVVTVDGGLRLKRGADVAKDQSYVLAMMGPEVLERVVFPVGRLTKADVRGKAARLGLRTADKPESQDVCFIQSGEGRRHFLEERIPLHPAELVDVGSGEVVGTVPAAELITVGQRRGLGVAVDGRRRYALSVDVRARRIAVGVAERALATHVAVHEVRWAARPLEHGAAARAQTTAHGRAATCRWLGDAVAFDDPQPLVAPGQTVAIYDAGDPELVVGAAIAMTAHAPPATQTRRAAG